jgi:isocitrate lyase
MTAAAIKLETHAEDRLQAKRFEGIVRPYAKADIERLRGSIQIEYTLARQGARRLWELLHTEPFVAALGALTGNQAVQQVRAGLKAIYLSGWQVAADANTAGQMYPDQSLYPVNSVPTVVRRINSSLQRADQIEHAEGKHSGTHWFAPIMADAEAGFGGPLNAYELMKSMIEAGAAGVHFEDQLASEKKCGHRAARCWCRRASSSAPSSRPASPPTCAACRRSSSRVPTPTARSSSRATSTSAIARSSSTTSGPPRASTA